MTQVKHAHSSSRYDRAPSKLADEVARGAGHVDPSCNLMTFTEVGTPERASTLQADGWATYAPHQHTDCAVMWRKERWKLLKSSTHQLTDKTWVVSGQKHHLVAAKVVLEAKDHGQVIWLAVAHFPSSVQGKGGFSDEHPDRVKAWKDGLQGLHSWKEAQRQQWKPDWLGACADWNLDMKVGWCRQTIKDTFDQWHCTWQSPYPNGGTHGDRLIDAVWCNGTTTKCQLLKDDDSSDHRPWWHVTEMD